MSNDMYKRVGVVMLAGGFLFGAYQTVSQAQGVPWTPYAIGFVVLLIGVIFSRLGRRVGAEHSEEINQNIELVRSSLKILLDRVRTMNAEREKIDAFDFCTRIDEDCMDAINNFVEAREAVSHHFGLATYARLMDNFALGERALNRAWCASADGYIDEVYICLDRAELRIGQAAEVLSNAQASSEA